MNDASTSDNTDTVRTSRTREFGGAVTTDVGPFAIVPLWLCDSVADEPNGARALHVFIALHRWTNRDRDCYPSMTSIAKAVGVNIATARRAIQTLQRIGAVVVTPRVVEGTKERTSNLYRLRYVASTRVGASTDAMTYSHGSEDTSSRQREKNHIHTEPDPTNQHKQVTEISSGRLESDDWLVFWKAYPRSEGKVAAQRAWRKMSAQDRADALATLPVHVLHWRARQIARTYIPHASTWLNGRRWEDDLGDPAEDMPLTKRIARFALEADKLNAGGQQ